MNLENIERAKVLIDKIEDLDQKLSRLTGVHRVQLENGSDKVLVFNKEDIVALEQLYRNRLMARRKDFRKQLEAL